MSSTAKDVKQHKAAAWRACNELNKIWKSSLSRKFKLWLFSATVESALLYSCEAWTITPKLTKKLDSCYTCLLRCVLNVHSKQHITNAKLYGDLPKITQKIGERRTKFAGHCARTKEFVSKLVNWTQSMGWRNLEDPPWTVSIYSSRTLVYMHVMWWLQW